VAKDELIKVKSPRNIKVKHINVFILVFALFMAFKYLINIQYTLYHVKK